MNRSIPIKITGNDTNIIKALFSTNNVSKGAEAKIHTDSKLICENILIRRGFIESSVIINAVITVGTSVTATVLSAWLIDKLKTKNDCKIKIDNVVINANDRLALEAALKGLKGE